MSWHYGAGKRSKHGFLWLTNEDWYQFFEYDNKNCIGFISNETDYDSWNNSNKNTMLSTSTYHIPTLKSALRFLKKNSFIPKGTKFTLISRYKGYANIYITK